MYTKEGNQCAPTKLENVQWVKQSLSTDLIVKTYGITVDMDDSEAEAENATKMGVEGWGGGGGSYYQTKAEKFCG